MLLASSGASARKNRARFVGRMLGCASWLVNGGVWQSDCKRSPLCMPQSITFARLKRGRCNCLALPRCCGTSELCGAIPRRSLCKAGRNTASTSKQKRAGSCIYSAPKQQQRWCRGALQHCCCQPSAPDSGAQASRGGSRACPRPRPRPPKQRQQHQKR